MIPPRSLSADSLDFRTPRRSKTVLGRRDTQERFARDGTVKVSAVLCCAGTCRQWLAYIPTAADGTKPAGPKVMYRIRVKRKVAA